MWCSPRASSTGFSCRKTSHFERGLRESPSVIWRTSENSWSCWRGKESSENPEAPMHLPLRWCGRRMECYGCVLVTGRWTGGQFSTNTLLPWIKYALQCLSVCWIWGAGITRYQCTPMTEKRLPSSVHWGSMSSIGCLRDCQAPQQCFSDWWRVLWETWIWLTSWCTYWYLCFWNNSGRGKVGEGLWKTSWRGIEAVSVSNLQDFSYLPGSCLSRKYSHRSNEVGKLGTVTMWPRPRAVTELKSFLGFFTYYRDL